MALDPDVLAWLRSQVGDEPDDAMLTSVYDRFVAAEDPEPANATAKWILSKRLADFIAKPASLSVGGELSRSTSANITALQKQLAGLAGDTTGDGIPDLPTVVVTPVYADRYRRR